MSLDRNRGHLGHRTTALLAFLATTLSVGTPAQAHNYPDPGSHRWQLYDQESVNYTVCEDSVTTTTSRKEVGRRELSSVMEETEKVTTEERRNDAPIITIYNWPNNKELTERAGPKTIFNTVSGRVQKFYTKQRFDEYKVTRTEQPYKLFDVTRWQRRYHKVFEVTYRVTDTLTWTDPKTGETLSQAAPSYDVTASEPVTTAWEPKSSEVVTKVAVDPPVDVYTYLSYHEVDTFLYARSLATLNAGGAGSKAKVAANAFAGDRSRQAAQARVASGAQARTMLGQASVAAKAQGTVVNLSGQNGAASQAVTWPGSFQGTSLYFGRGPSDFVKVTSNGQLKKGSLTLNATSVSLQNGVLSVKFKMNGQEFTASPKN
ncbi:MAG: hypothetical protein VKO64_13060 [Candidatus Sericytochromatia bacterium]|nr:hypothetical protein [Candidatus Sericytochromatia bacterium]